MSYPNAIIEVSKEKEIEMNEYTLYRYTFNDKVVVSAIHWRDGAKFRAEHPDSVVIPSSQA